MSEKFIKPTQKADFNPQPQQFDCKRCGCKFESLVLPYEGLVFHADYCDTCEPIAIAESEAREKEMLANADRLAREAHFAKECPQWDCPTDINRLPAERHEIDKVLNWQYGAKGLLILGHSGMGKTRTIWMLLKRLMVDERRDVITIKSTKLSQQLVSSYAKPGVHEQMIERLQQAQILFIDDLGKQKFTDNHDADLFSIIDERTERGRPTLVTTRYPGEDLAARFADGITGRDIVRRLREFSKVAWFRDDLQEHPTQPALATAFKAPQPGKLDPRRLSSTSEKGE